MSDQDKVAVTDTGTFPEGASSGFVPSAAPPDPSLSLRVPFHAEVLRSGQHLLRSNPALALTLGYLFLTAVGMVYEWLFFDHFGLQIFNYAEPTDFLLVTLREPMLLLYTLLSLVVLVQFSRGHNRRLGKYARYRRVHTWLSAKPWFGAVERILYILLLIAYFTSLTSAHAESKAKHIHEGKGSRVRVELMSDAANAKADEKPGREYLLLGTTGKFLLLYDATSKSTEAVVIGNVARITAEP